MNGDVMSSRRWPRTILRIENLSTHFSTKDRIVRAVDGVDVEVMAGEIVGLVGESGSGKTMVALSTLGLIDPPGRIISGKILFDGVDLLSLTEPQLRELRGNRISMVFQDPSMTLSPTLRIGRQMHNVIRAHRKTSRAEARALCRDALGKLGIPSPDERLDCFPHQLSGGMRQRVCIAMAMLNRPALVIADEPTTALDVTTQAQILDEVKRLRDETGTAFIWITHDLAVVSELADRIMVMYAGQIVEDGMVDQVLEAPSHPYTRCLLDCVPSNNVDVPRLPESAAAVRLTAPQSDECKFRPRCPQASARCATRPELRFDPVHARGVRCFHPIVADQRIDEAV
jgi:peptide/nickel transport system ATP-binding protein